jgi:hypothetical protein
MPAVSRQSVEIPLYNLHIIWAIYILGLCSSWGTSQICPSWSPSEHLLTPALSPFGGPRVWSHAIQRRLFIVLMTAAHISPVFSLRKFLSNIQRLFLCYIINHSYLLYITFMRTFTSFILHVCIRNFIFFSSDLHGRLAALGSLFLIHQVWQEGLLVMTLSSSPAHLDYPGPTAGF